MQLSNLGRSNLFFPFLLAIWGVLYILFGEKLPVSDGLGWDGFVYAEIAKGLSLSPSINDYSVFRIVPSYIIHFLFSLLKIPLVPSNIVQGFLFLDLACLVSAFYFLQKLMDHFKIDYKWKAIGSGLFFLSFCVCRFIFYYPVLTDASGLLLSTLVLYAYLRSNIPLLAIVALISAFTWPMLFYMAFFLLVFPFHGISNEEKLPGKTWNIVSALGILIPLLLYTYVFGFGPVGEYMLAPQPLWLPVSILALGILYWFLADIIPARLVNTSIFKEISFPGLTIFIVLFIIIRLGGKTLNIHNFHSSYMSLEYLFEMPLSRGVARPFINMASHFAFFGIVVAMIVTNWNNVAAVIRGLGPGISLALALNLFWLLPNSETRTITHLLPWLVIFVVISFKGMLLAPKSNFLLFLLALVSSKIWLRIDYDNKANFNPAEPIGFPNQKFFMHLGPWISESMWLVHLLGLVASVLILKFVILKESSTSNEKVIHPELRGEVQ